MKKHFTHFQLLLGVFCMVVGLLVIMLISSPGRYVGLVFLVLAIWLLAGEIYSKLSSSDGNNYRSQTRDQILKHQYKR